MESYDSPKPRRSFGKMLLLFLGVVFLLMMISSLIKTFFSDGIIESDNQIAVVEVEGMITRKDPHTNEGETLSESVDLETAIKIYTMNGARAMMHEDMAGSIEVGKHADMVLLDKNLFEIDPTEISEVKVLATVFASAYALFAKLIWTAKFPILIFLPLLMIGFALASINNIRSTLAEFAESES